MISAFSLVRTAFLSSYNNILLIFSLASIVFLSIYKNIVRLLAWHSKFKKRQALKKNLSHTQSWGHSDEMICAMSDGDCHMLTKILSWLCTEIDIPTLKYLARYTGLAIVSLTEITQQQFREIFLDWSGYS